MNKLLTVLLILSLLAAPCALAEDDEGGLVVGMLTQINASEDELSGLLGELSDEKNLGIPKRKFVYFDSLNEMLMAINADYITSIGRLPRFVAEYIVARNPALAINAEASAKPIALKLCMALPVGGETLLQTINEAIQAMDEDGTLLALQQAYLYDFDTDAEPRKVDMPVIEGAPVLRVVVTGDLPPLDYITADDVPAGYNVAFLTALSERIGMNVELVASNATSRAMMLASGRADAVFWMRETVFDYPAYKYTLSEAEGALLYTEPYLTADTAVIEKIK